MTTLLLPAVFAIFIWWFSTGLILLLDNLPRTTFRWSIVLSSLLAGGALLGLAHTASQTTEAAAYCAFTCALLVWGWHELTFLTGWLTGPRKIASPAGLTGWPRFSQAVAAILWHEIGILAMGAAIVAITWNAPNQVGTWTFAVLWTMRTSAKLNLFLGVRNLSEEFLPPHLKYLQSFFRRRKMNLLFPLSVTAATAVAAMMVAAALQAPAAEAVGLVLVTTMLALAILEHWLLVLPLPSTALWRWAMRQPTPEPAAARPDNEDILLHAR
ncbi:putative photosynthetic complex assembly protein PuhE [Rubrivivax sp. RP6-9]|uniref:putative photosynthetic complex assembly protein PuhE n=1 Tax=Rubrivivax sp. RP6-9 TaxID=3415750 RepID=UPI003CC643DD